MKAKDYLKQLDKMNAIIQNKMIEKSQWHDIALGVTAHSGGERVQSSGSQQKMSDALNRCIDIEREIDRLIDVLIDTKLEIIRTIESLNATEYKVIHMRHIQGMTFDEIGDVCDKSKSWATTVYGRALQHLQWILDERETPGIHAAQNNFTEVYGEM